MRHSYPIELVEGLQIFHDDFCERDRMVTGPGAAAFEDRPSRQNIEVDDIPSVEVMLQCDESLDVSDVYIPAGGHAWWIEQYTSSGFTKAKSEGDKAWLRRLWAHTLDKEGEHARVPEPESGDDLDRFIVCRVRP